MTIAWAAYYQRGDSHPRERVGSKEGSRWYRRFRGVSYAGTLVVIVWTAVIVIPVSPFSEVPRIVVGVPGEWLLVGYLLYILLGCGAFGWLSGMLRVLEHDEGRALDNRLMWPGFLLLAAGVTASCLLLGYAGAVGGNAALNGSATPLQQLLSPYVDPISGTALISVTGAAAVLAAMIRAEGP